MSRGRCRTGVGEHARELGLADALQTQDAKLPPADGVLEAGARAPDRARSRRCHVPADDTFWSSASILAGCRLVLIIDAIGTPVHFDTTSSISALPTMYSARRRLDVELLADELRGSLTHRDLLLADQVRPLEIFRETHTFHLLDGAP